MNKVIQLTIFSICFVCFSFISLYSQTTKKEKKGNYKVTVTTMDKSSKAKGYITEVADSSVIVTDLSTTDSKIINVNVMDEIKFKRKGGLGRGILYGALVGMTTGALLGFASGDDRSGFISFNAEFKALMGGLAMTIPGAIIGGIIGHNSKITIPIKGSQNAYDRQKEKLRKYKLSF
jgi:hypothetical protein